MDPIAFVEQHGVVLEGGRGPRPNLAEAAVGEPVRDSWWGHKKGRTIFRATRTVRDCDEVLICRLVGGKITYVHRRLCPAIVRLANSLDKKTLAALREEHTPSGAHRVRTIPFPLHRAQNGAAWSKFAPAAGESADLSATLGITSRLLVTRD